MTRIVDPQPFDRMADDLLKKETPVKSSAVGELVLDDEYVEHAMQSRYAWFHDNGVTRRPRPGFHAPIASTRISDD